MHSSPWEPWLGAQCTPKSVLVLKVFLKGRFVVGVNFPIYTRNPFSSAEKGYNFILHITENNPYCRRQLPKSGIVNIYTGLPTVSLYFTSSLRIMCMRSANFIDMCSVETDQGSHRDSLHRTTWQVLTLSIVTNRFSLL